jgi:hypothetical protein
LYKFFLICRFAAFFCRFAVAAIKKSGDEKKAATTLLIT